MGKLFKPMQVSWQGELGGIVCRYTRGQYVVSRPPRGGHSTITPAQQEQMARFGLAGRLVAVANLFIKNGFKLMTSEHGTPQNMFMHYVLRDAIISTGTTATLDLDRVKWSMGGHLNVGNPAAVQGTGHSIDISWTDNSSASRDASTEDFVALMLFNPDRYAAVIDINSAIRANEEKNLQYPAEWVGDKVTVFVYTISPDGKLVATSAKIATITAA